jgi:predicted  nucleic acid-binding Zn-ribbon protein
MNDLLQQLITLTEVDHSIIETRDQLGRSPQQIDRMNAAEIEQRMAIETAEKELEAARHDRRAAEKEMAVQRDKITRYLAQQSTVKTNKEYQANMAEIEAVRGRLDEWETVGLEKLEIEEVSAARIEQARRRLEALVTEYAEERARIENQVREKNERIARLEAERDRRRAALPEEWRDQYDLQNERYPGSVCAPVQGGQCGGCHWQLVPQTRQRVHRGGEIVVCDHCRRFIFEPPAH